MKINDGIILAGGLGSRLLPLTTAIPKAMLPLGKQPAIHYLLDNYFSIGIENIIIVVNHKKNVIIDYVNSMFSTKKHKIKFLNQPSLNGTGGGLEICKDHLKSSTFLLSFCDDFCNQNPFPDLIEAHNQTNKNVMAVKEIKDFEKENFGTISFKKKINDLFVLDNIFEKDINSPTTLANFGKYVLKNEIFDILKTVPIQNNGEKYLTDALVLLAKNEKVVAKQIKQKTFDIGNFEGYQKSFQYFSNQ